MAEKYRIVSQERWETSEIVTETFTDGDYCFRKFQEKMGAEVQGLKQYVYAIRMRFDADRARWRVLDSWTAPA